MMGEHELLGAIEGLEAETLQRWVDLGWVLPSTDGEAVRFDATDVARVRLIFDLQYELRIEESSLAVVLSLMDQLYEVRRDLRRLAAAVELQPQDVRAAIAKRIGGK